jgi:hypothetical protein
MLARIHLWLNSYHHHHHHPQHPSTFLCHRPLRTAPVFTRPRRDHLSIGLISAYMLSIPPTTCRYLPAYLQKFLSLFHSHLLYHSTGQMMRNLLPFHCPLATCLYYAHLRHHLRRLEHFNTAHIVRKNHAELTALLPLRLQLDDIPMASDLVVHFPRQCPLHIPSFPFWIGIMMPDFPG